MTTTDAPTRYREIEVSGPPRRLGQLIGEAARDEIQRFCDVALDRVGGAAPFPREVALEVARNSIPIAGRYAPRSLDELRGIAEGASVSLEEVMLLQVRNQLASSADAGCTSVALLPEPLSGRGPVVAQNWDNAPELDPFIVVLTRRPEDGPASMTIGPAGLIGYIGFNDQAMAACLNTLPAPSRPLGVPHYFILREILRTRSLEKSISAVRRAHRAIPANIMLSTPDGPADLEVTLDDVHVLRNGRPQGSLAHTNHCLHPGLAELSAPFGDLAQSRDRMARVDALLNESGWDEAGVISALRDHAAYPRSICRHANTDADVGYWQTVFSVIIEPRESRMRVSRGNPCTQPYQRYSLA